jgi:hypothetical protein
MLYHFEFLGERCWEAFGSGEGSGKNAIAMAIADLTAVAGGALPVGEWRCIAATSDDPRWQSLEIDTQGRILATEAAAR